jgi:hypothetical protein
LQIYPSDDVMKLVKNNLSQSHNRINLS